MLAFYSALNISDKGHENILTYRQLMSLILREHWQPTHSPTCLARLFHRFYIPFPVFAKSNIPSVFFFMPL